MEKLVTVDQSDKDSSTYEISGFADQLASCVLQETIHKSGTEASEDKEDQDWSIPCSRVCHQHAEKRKSDQCLVKTQLCWTPESGGSLENTVTQCSNNIENITDDGVTMVQDIGDEILRKGVSVPNVSVCIDGGEDGDTEESKSNVFCSSENIKSHKRGFFSFGLKTKHKSDANSPNTRPKMKTLKKTLSSLFSAKTRSDQCSPEELEGNKKHSSSRFRLPSVARNKSKYVDPCQRALPPVPPPRDVEDHDDVIDDNENIPVEDHEATPQHSPSQTTPRSDSEDFMASIERVKDRGWYWGPLSGEAAERILSGEPDGSFVVRDSSDHHYIFSLTFKLNGFVRHVRIEHDQGNFSFGSFTRFKSTTIVDFIENAVEHSRSGRYLFFLHRRPVLGPMRVQLLHPVSRFKRVQSLQHLCRYVIVKVVRKDHLDQLPVPSRIKKYLNTRFYYTEQVTGNEETSDVPQTLEQIEENVTNWNFSDDEPDTNEETLENVDDEAVTT